MIYSINKLNLTHMIIFFQENNVKELKTINKEKFPWQINLAIENFFARQKNTTRG